MTMPIIITQGVQILGGPAITEVETLQANAWDKVEKLLPVQSGTIMADIHPVISAMVDLLFITSDNYEDVYYASHIETPAVAGYHISFASPSTDISSLTTGAKMKIKVDGSATYSEITVNATSLDSGAEIASAIQDAIQSLGGVYAAVTFVYANYLYICTSGTTGVGSKVRITRGTTNDMTELLKMGTAPESPP
jgi:hypothetical protein